MARANEFPGINVSLSPLEREVRTAAFRAVYQGKAPSASALADDLHRPIEAVKAAIDSLSDLGLMTVDAAGLVTGSHGLSLVPSEHRVTFDLGVRHVWCAVDAVGIPAAMGVDARVESRCFHCSAAVSLTMSGGEPRGPESMSLRIGLAVAGCTGKVIEDVCPMLNFFCSLEHADRWATTVVGASIITVRQAAEMGRRTWSDIAPG